MERIATGRKEARIQLAEKVRSSSAKWEGSRGVHRELTEEVGGGDERVGIGGGRSKGGGLSKVDLLQRNVYQRMPGSWGGADGHRGCRRGQRGGGGKKLKVRHIHGLHDMLLLVLKVLVVVVVMIKLLLLLLLLLLQSR